MLFVPQCRTARIRSSNAARQPESLLNYWGRSRCVDFWAVQGATREHTPRGSVTEEQRSTAQKAAQPFGRGHLGPSGGVASSLQPAAGMRVARALPYDPI